MSWKDKLRPASFRGVEFFVDTSSKTTGRRAVLHEFPNRDTPYAEDLGRAADTYDVDGHILGDDYLDRKKILEDAFTKRGPGELIHPYYGSLIVQVSSVQFSENTKDGRIVSFSVSFLEAGDNRFPKGLDDKGAILDTAADTALAAAKDDFVESFSIVDMPGFAVDSARAAIALAQETFDNVTKTFADVSDAVADVAFSTRNLVAETNDLLQSPSVLADRLLGSFSLMEDAFSRAKSKTNAYASFFGFGDDDKQVAGDTPIREREKENKKSFNNYMKRVAAIKSTTTAISVDYPSLQDAESQRDSIVIVIEAQIRESENTEFYQAMIDLKSSLVNALPDPDVDLPGIKEITTESVMPSLILSYDLFNNPDTEQDIIKRNKIRHPGFVGAGLTLEVVDV